MSKEHNNRDLCKPEVQAELAADRTKELIEQHLSKTVVSQMRTSAAIKVTGGHRPSQLVGLLKVAPDGAAYWSVEQRFGFPYAEIQDRDMRRTIWVGLEAQDEDDWLRVLIIDQQHNFAASIRIPYAAERGSA